MQTAVVEKEKEKECFRQEGFQIKQRTEQVSAGRHTARHSQKEAVLHEWPATGRNMPDSAPCVCVFVPLLILSHVFIMRPPLLQLSRAERAGDEWSRRTGDQSRSRRRRQTERHKQSHEAAADFTL